MTKRTIVRRSLVIKYVETKMKTVEISTVGRETATLKIGLTMAPAEKSGRWIEDIRSLRLEMRMPIFSRGRAANSLSNLWENSVNVADKDWAREGRESISSLPWLMHTATMRYINVPKIVIYNKVHTKAATFLGTPLCSSWLTGFSIITVIIMEIINGIVHGKMVLKKNFSPKKITRTYPTRIKKLICLFS